MYVTPYGMRPFQITKSVKRGNFEVQHKGVYKLPKGVKRNDGSKWDELSYWFDERTLYTKIKGDKIALSNLKGKLNYSNLADEKELSIKYK